ncbi:hypothetical protein [Sphingobacterium thalpophilum]|uniref:Uncharacterized protein n=1 Tax=Sphingobacterium thalpophilum TaxID=259 RepID=A0A4V6KS35_9SPHI|nr:hypothetical protein [Sphingobacterium thalpophilum]VTR43668.1 Uncharacterised protein [Sphingobacterium thalpophilum]
MILNKEYYQTLWDRFRSAGMLGVFNDNISCLTTKLILEHNHKNKAVHFNFQNSKEIIFEIGQYLFLEFANDIYKNHYDLPTLTKGSRLRDKRKYTHGKKHDYVIKGISNGSYLLEHTKNKAQLNIKYDDLVKKFIPIEQGTRQTTLQGYTKFFSDLNKALKLDFTPTNFEKKTVFIARKTLWDSLPNRNKIPCAYLPNPREEQNASWIRSIPALQDCLAYFTPKYEVCYSNILLRNEKVKTIVVFDTEADKIEQMVSDKNRFGFNLIIISNSDFSKLVKSQSIPCWNWFKEEIEIVNAL